MLDYEKYLHKNRREHHSNISAVLRSIFADPSVGTCISIVSASCELPHHDLTAIDDVDAARKMLQGRNLRSNLQASYRVDVEQLARSLQAIDAQGGVVGLQNGESAVAVLGVCRPVAIGAIGIVGIDPDVEDLKQIVAEGIVGKDRIGQRPSCAGAVEGRNISGWRGSSADGKT